MTTRDIQGTLPVVANFSEFTRIFLEKYLTIGNFQLLLSFEGEGVDDRVFSGKTVDYREFSEKTVKFPINWPWEKKFQ